MPIFRWFFPIIIILAAGLVPAPAQDDFSFYIERIDIRGADAVPRDLILAEARLREGQVYRESELRAAQQRLNRLTFVLDSDIMLEKGSERNQYVLVLTIEETKNWFFDIDGFLENDFNEGVDTESEDDRLTLGIGYRWFPQGEDLVYAVLRPSYLNEAEPSTTVNATLGYAHYNLFDKNVFFNLQLDFEDEIEEFDVFEGQTFRNWRGRDDHLEIEAKLYVPLSPTKFWKTVFTMDELDAEFAEGTYRGTSYSDAVQADRLRFSTFWEYNTVDDNLLPNKGTIFQVGLALADWDGNQLVNEVRGNLTGESQALFANYRRFHRLGQRHFFSWGTGLEVGKQELEYLRRNFITPTDPVLLNDDSDYVAWRLEGSYKFLLTGSAQRERVGDIWLEAGFNLIARDDSAFTLFGPLPENGPVNLGTENQDVEAYSVSLNYRGKWGVMRLSFLGEW